ncbi:hypothetical protein OH76DRAFT_193727 [Lentinus brumalis]|uniref:Uncharacterized protein n=1 Tax=Lentinus brumalis TaxID=2498619 RepID=A0A371DHV4_9APHY|nr:hypothetical protein OH76DRAFT_193727 [Polyporus brumalis]
MGPIMTVTSCFVFVNSLGKLRVVTSGSRTRLRRGAGTREMQASYYRAQRRTRHRWLAV